MNVVKNFLTDLSLERVEIGVDKYKKQHNMLNGHSYESAFILIKDTPSYTDFNKAYPEFYELINPLMSGYTAAFLKIVLHMDTATTGAFPHIDRHLQDNISDLKIKNMPSISLPAITRIFYICKDLDGGNLEVENNGEIVPINVENNILVSFDGGTIHGVTPILSCTYKVFFAIELHNVESEICRELEKHNVSNYFKIWEVKKNSKNVADIHAHTVKRNGDCTDLDTLIDLISKNEKWRKAISYITSVWVLRFYKSHKYYD